MCSEAHQPDRACLCTISMLSHLPRSLDGHAFIGPITSPTEWSSDRIDTLPRGCIMRLVASADVKGGFGIGEANTRGN